MGILIKSVHVYVHKYYVLSRFLKFDSKSLASLLAYTVFVTSHIGEMLKEKIKNAMSEVNYFLII